MRLIEPVAAFLPYMTSPGNHGILFSFLPTFFSSFSLFVLCVWREREHQHPLIYSQYAVQ